MSIEIMSKVWKEAPYHGNKLLCLLACADWANDDGEVFPSYNKIGTKIRITRRSAIRLLSSFVDDGTVSKIHRRNKNTHSSNLFKIHPENFAKIASLMESSKQEREVLGDSPVTVKKKRVVTATSPSSDSNVTGVSDSNVTHIHHVEPSPYPSLIVENPKANFPLANDDAQSVHAQAELCACGDRRFEHHEDGACKLNGLGHGILASEPENRCDEFRPTGYSDTTGLSTVQANGDSVTPPPNGPPPKDEKPQTDHQRMMAALDRVSGGRKILNGAAQGKAIKKILTGYTADQAIECLEWMADPQSWWKGNADWLSVQNQILSYLNRKEQQPQTKLGGNNGKSKLWEFCNSQPLGQF